MGTETQMVSRIDPPRWVLCLKCGTYLPPQHSYFSIKRCACEAVGVNNTTSTQLVVGLSQDWSYAEDPTFPSTKLEESVDTNHVITLIKGLISVMVTGAKNSYDPFNGRVVIERRQDGVCFRYQSDLSIAPCGLTIKVNAAGEVVMENWQKGTPSRRFRTGLSMTPEDLHDIADEVCKEKVQREYQKLAVVNSQFLPTSMVAEAFETHNSTG